MAANMMDYARPLSYYGVGGPSWGSIFVAPGSCKPGMPFDSGLGRLPGTLLQMNRLSLRNNRLRFKTAGKVSIIIEEFIYIYTTPI